MNLEELREGCAKICDQFTHNQSDASKDFAMGIEHGAMKCANAIRALPLAPLAPEVQEAVELAKRVIGAQMPNGWLSDSPTEVLARALLKVVGQEG